MHTHRRKTVFLARQWRWKIWNFCMILLRNVCEKRSHGLLTMDQFLFYANEVGQDGHKNKQEILSFPLFFLLLSLIWAKFPRAIKRSLHNSACSRIKEQRIVLLNASLGTRELFSSSFQLACTRLSVNIDKRRSRRVIKGWGQTWRLQLSWKHLSFCLFFVFLLTEPTPYFARPLFRLSRLCESPEKVTFQRPSDHSHTRPGILIWKTWVHVFPRLSLAGREKGETRWAI